MSWTVYESPLGPLTLTGGPSGLRSLHFPGRSPALDEVDRDPTPFAQASGQLEQYFRGDRRVFDLKLDLRGTPFQLSVWRTLQTIPYGQTTTYGAVARQLEVAPTGRVSAAQKVGWAVGGTPTPIIVPCHRVLAADGSLTGYLGGLQRKQSLLDLEHDGVAPADWGSRQLALI